jgi:hypothetical protein
MLFVAGIIFAPWIAVFVIIPMITTGNVVLIALDTWRYTVPFLIALLPYIVLKTTKIEITPSKSNFVVMVVLLVPGFCFFVFFSLLVLQSCAGHPPY